MKFANISHRFLSGSENGRISIWNYQEFKFSEHLIDIYKSLIQNESRNDKLIITAIEWSCDDTLIIIAMTIFSDKTMIKGFNSINGSLVHEFTVISKKF